MRNGTSSSWRDRRYIATVLGLLVFGFLVFYAGLTDGPPALESVAFFGIAIGAVGWVWQDLWVRLS